MREVLAIRANVENSKSTMPMMYRPLMDCPSIRDERCVWCGATWPLNQHHLVYRSQGELYRDGRKLEKPTVTLCGSGNASGCHGKAHQRRLHFKYEDGLWGLETAEPTKYEKALDMDGWRRISEPL